MIESRTTGVAGEGADGKDDWDVQVEVAVSVNTWSQERDVWGVSQSI